MNSLPSIVTFAVATSLCLWSSVFPIQAQEVVPDATIRADAAPVTLGKTSTADGYHALRHNTTGDSNNAYGFDALYFNTVGSRNTANGHDALRYNTTANDNSAAGYRALYGNTTGSFNTAAGSTSLFTNTAGNDNTANGYQALYANDTGNDNAAFGFEALFSNTSSGNAAFGSGALTFNSTGIGNVAMGFGALGSNTVGIGSTAIGYQALSANTVTGSTAIGYQALTLNTAPGNTATGFQALASNVSGTRNTAMGYQALTNSTSDSQGVSTFDNTVVGYKALAAQAFGSSNTAIGSNTLLVSSGAAANVAVGANAMDGATTGSYNTAIGESALAGVGAGSNNIAVGNQAGVYVSGNYCIEIGSEGSTTSFDDHTMRLGDPNLQTNTYIAGIRTTTMAAQAVVYIDSDGQLGVAPSSERFKDGIREMGDSSASIYALRPVTFRYKPEYDPQGFPEFGLVAEEVEKINPALVVHDPDGKPFTVRYEQVNAMLLNEFLKEHVQVQALAAAIPKLEAKSQDATKLEDVVAQQQREIAALMAELHEQAALMQKVSAQLEMDRQPWKTVTDRQ